MTAEMLDTNVIVRFLVGDIPAYQRNAESWFKDAAEGKRALVVTPIVIAETCFVLESNYKKKRGEIAGALEVFLSQRWLQVEERDLLLGLWRWYRQGLHFVDSYLLAWVHIHNGSILTFDKEINKKSVV